MQYAPNSFYHASAPNSFYHALGGHLAGLSAWSPLLIAVLLAAAIMVVTVAARRRATSRSGGGAIRTHEGLPNLVSNQAP